MLGVSLVSAFLGAFMMFLLMTFADRCKDDGWFKVEDIMPEKSANSNHFSADVMFKDKKGVVFCGHYDHVFGYWYDTTEGGSWWPIFDVVEWKYMPVDE